MTRASRPVLRHEILLALLLVSGIAAPATAQRPCDDPESERWVKDIHGRVISFDVLVGYAIEHYGPPVTCRGEVTSEFDGNEFGAVRLYFADGAVFEIETFPPEASVASLSDSSGFEDTEAVRTVLKEYAADIGLSIDWTNPVFEANEDRIVETYWDPDDGLNASARLVFRDTSLVAVRLSLAL